MTIAQITPDWTALLVQGGIAGIVLGWFMWRTEGRLKCIENAVDRMAKANLLLVISLKQANDAAKSEANSLLREIEDARARDGK